MTPKKRGEPNEPSQFGGLPEAAVSCLVSVLSSLPAGWSAPVSEEAAVRPSSQWSRSTADVGVSFKYNPDQISSRGCEEDLQT